MTPSAAARPNALPPDRTMAWTCCTVLTGSTPIFDLPQQRLIKSEPGVPTVIPEGAVVVPGARAVTSAPGNEWGLSLATPVIVKYRDDRTDTKTELEAWIR